MKQNRALKPHLTDRNIEIQPYGTIANRLISLDHKVRSGSVEALNQILADTCALRDLYKKHHWQASGPAFYQLHLLFDKHFSEQAQIVDSLAERIQTLGGVSIAVAADVAETTRIARPPRGRESVTVQLFRLSEAHELVIGFTREAARAAAKLGDDGTNDLLISQVLRVNEFQAWFVSEQLAGVGIKDQDEEAALFLKKGHS